MKISEENFAAFQAQTRKRKLLKRKREAKIADLCASLSKQLCEMTGTPLYTNPDEAKLYRTLKDTFNAFDRDGNAELGFPEYLEAWRFLNQPGTDEDVKKAFDGNYFSRQKYAVFELDIEKHQAFAFQMPISKT